MNFSIELNLIVLSYFTKLIYKLLYKLKNLLSEHFIDLDKLYLVKLGY